MLLSLVPPSLARILLKKQSRRYRCHTAITGQYGQEPAIRWGFQQTMENKVCPSCGSQYFLSARTQGKRVFHVHNSGELLPVAEDSAQSMTLEVDPQHIYCGACSWSGRLDALQSSTR